MQPRPFASDVPQAGALPPGGRGGWWWWGPRSPELQGGAIFLFYQVIFLSFVRDRADIIALSYHLIGTGPAGTGRPLVKATGGPSLWRRNGRG